MGALGVLWTTLVTGVCLQAARGAAATENPCGPNKKMYHPYPGDPSRYIQCTKQGRMYVRHCNSGQRWDKYQNTCVKDRYEHAVQKVAPQTHTYKPHEPRDKVKYVETNYAPSPKNQFQGFSPLSYMYLMSGQPTFAFDTQTYGDSGNSAGSRYSSGLSSYFRTGSSSPSTNSRYQYSFIPGNRRVVSTSYGTAGGSSYGNAQSMRVIRPSVSYKSTQGSTAYGGTSQGNAQRDTYSNAKSSSSSARYGTSDSSMRVISPQVSYKRVQGKSLVPLSYQQGGSSTGGASSYGTMNSNRYYVSSGSPAGTGYFSTAYSSGSSAPYGSSYSLPHGTSYSTVYGAAQAKTLSASYSASQDYGGTAYRAPQTNTYGLSQGSAQGTGSWSSNGNSATYATGYAIPYKSGRDTYGSAHSTGYVSAPSKLHAPQDSSYLSSTYGSAKSTGYHTAYDRQASRPQGTSSLSNSQYHGLPYAGNQHGIHQPAPAKSVASNHPVQGKSTMDHTHKQAQPAQHAQALSIQCTGGNVRFFADPNSQRHYYECQSHYKLARHSCDGNTKWVQPLRMCVDMQDRLSTAVPTVNPCAATDTMYKPYPTDPSKYIECRNWYSILVWSCRPHQVWAQEQQKCVDMKMQHPIVHAKPVVHPKPIEPKQYPPHQHKVKTGNSTCINSLTYYERYLPDPSKYIQCDDFGKQFIRDCFSGGTWDDLIKACTKNLGVEPETMTAFEYDFNRAKPLNMDDYEASYDTGASYQYTSAHTGAKTYNYQPPASKCYEHQLWVPSLLKCVSLDSAVIDSENCHPGDYFFPDHHICAAVKTTTIEPKSFPIGTVTYTDYNSYTGDDKQQYDSYRTDASSIQVTSTNDHCRQYEPDPNDEGPCGMGDVAYHEFPADPKCFVQCNQNNVMFIMPCSAGTFWNQMALTCVADYLTEPENDGSTMRASGKSLYGSGAGDGSLGERKASADHQLGNLCDDEYSVSYKEHPESPHRFVMCTEHSGFSMSCPRHTLWRQDIQACFWPPSNANLK